jgi:type VI secretion system secreted protein VgrG
MLVQVDGAYGLQVVSASDDGGASLRVSGAYHVSTTRETVIRSDERLRLRCGDAEVVLSPDTIRICAPNIVMKATKSMILAGDGPSLSLKKEVEVASKKVSIFSESAAVELSDKAEIWGDKISLNPPRRPAPAKRDDSSDGPTQKVRVRFTDGDHEPHAGRTYHLFAGDARYVGKTDGDGFLDETVPKDVQHVEVTLWLDEYPEGRRQQHAFQLEPLAPTRSPRGAKQRLKRLGYYTGSVDDLADRALRDAVRWLQEDQEIEPATGDLDGPTVAKLESLYGH